VQAGALEHYEQPLYYEHAYRRRVDDVRYYVERARRARGAVLEYGAGTGRITLPMARAGANVWAVDWSKPMLGRLREHLAAEPELADRVKVRAGDMRSVRLGARFALVVAPFNTILHLYTRRDVERFLARVRAHLSDSGRFVFDFSLPRPADLAVDPERWYKAGRVRHPELGYSVNYSERFHYAPLTQVLSTWMRFERVHADGGATEGGSSEVLLTHRQFFPQELEALLHYNGFTDLRWSADFSDTPLGSRSDVAIVDCRLARVRPRDGG
jgi:SAM-dependent methyltransferase